MTRQELDDLEDALVDVATIRAHVETAVTFLAHDQVELATLELKRALAQTHHLKLKVMAVRWMNCPGTLQKLLKEQSAWLKRRYGIE